MKGKPERAEIRIGRGLGRFAGLMLLLAQAFSVAADAYPSRPIKLIVPWAVGGTADTRGRQVAEVLASELGQPVVVENRPGAGATIGAALVARAKPDGYTLLWGSVNELAIRPAAAKLAYDPLSDFAPVALVNVNALLLVVHPSVAAKSAQELVRLAKAKPGQLAYLKARIERAGAQAMVTSPEAFRRFLEGERAKWTDILRRTGISLED